MYSRILIILLITTGFGLSLPAAAQDTAPEKKEGPLDQTVDIDFSGGSIRDFVVAIQEESGVTPNVILSATASELVIPPVSLRSVSIGNLIMALEGLQEVAGYKIMVVPARDDLMTVSAIRVREPNPKMSMAFDLKSIFERGYSIDDIVTAIETAWKMQAASHDAELKFHKETNLLLAVGSRDDLRTVEAILETISLSQDREAESETVVALREEIAKVEAMVRELADDLHELRKQVKELGGTK
jgi:hypothetical protein